MLDWLSFHSVIHVAVMLLFPPLLLGVINRTKAKFAGRRGQPYLQPYYDLAKLFQKESVFSETTSWVFRFGPVVGLVTAVIAALVVPLGHASAPLSFTGDLIFFAYVLGLGRFFTMSAALDTGSAFEGMGAAREATFACLAEPVLFLGLLVLARVQRLAANEFHAGGRRCGRMVDGGGPAVADRGELVRGAVGRKLSHSF